LGLAIERDQFDEGDYERFSTRLTQCLDALEALLKRPGFGEGELSLGAELELSLVDRHALPLPLNLRVLAETVDPRMTVELDRFNLECNLRHGPLSGAPFRALEAEIQDALREIQRAADTHGARTVMIGVLPTLREQDLQSAAMTETPRFRALSASLQRLRHAPFQLRIDGADPLDIECDDVTFEGAATSLQVHLRVSPKSFASVYNAVQIATAPVLAASGNSPTFLGRSLWEETRVALFKQAVDHRGAGDRDNEARVSFGTGWVQSGVFELFAESVALHEPLLPVLSDEDPIAEVAAGRTPHLEEVRLHQGTVWRWNRAIFDPADDGHLRIEMRALPAGPTAIDMVANCAFLVGLSLGLAQDIDAWTAAFPFEAAHGNFYRAAQSGLEAELFWPLRPGERPEPFRAQTLIPHLMDLARAGLDSAGVEASESERLLELVAERTASGQTGAQWQRTVLANLEPTLGREKALAAMLERYIENSTSGEPVCRWATSGSGVA
jgi:gamma-glutamyl:cysteine ligase YbdK (ATP-grasp superfamily)